MPRGGILRSFLQLALGLLAGGLISAVPTVDINSGNPRYPFPQFMDYGPGRADLATHNPEGVPHAEMEQRTRDAYQINANEWSYENSPCGSPTWAGVKYINPFNANGDPYDTTEGEGYALLAAAYMADKTTFDGLWMRFHDVKLQMRPRYCDGVTPNPGYLYGHLPKDNTNDSAADGDFDCAMAILMAWYQFGDNMGVNDALGNPISYKAEALYLVNALVEKYRHFPLADCRTTSGDVGYDGYIKGGDTWGETTNFSNGQCPDGPEFAGNTTNYMDYAAPAWFHSMTAFLTAQAQPAFNITQMQRAEASSDWLMGQLYSQSPNNVPSVGQYSVAGTVPSFSNFNVLGEDYRAGWRTILNYVWNGNPTSTWNPTTHQPVAGANTYERDFGVRFANYLEDNRVAPWSATCKTFGSSPSTYWGVPAVTAEFGINGAPGTFHLNRFMGSGSPSAVASQNFHLMAELFRECVTVWDGVDGSQQYLASSPKYMHGWMRLLGMMILAGNYPDPSDLVAPGAGTPPANMKIYKAVDKTYAFNGDTVTYWINYRNYASTAATGVVVTDTLPAGLSYIAASPAPASTGGGVLRWNLPNVPGLVNQAYAATQGGITVTALVTASSGRLCNTADIACSNGTGWTSNEFPNEQSDVMKRNCVDIIPAALSLTKTANTNLANPGDTLTYTISYRDNPTPWLNGGRSGVVVSVGNDGISASGTYLNLKFRVGHGAEEALINYGNYRVSYFLNDPTLPTYVLANPIHEGAPPATTVFSQQNLIPGSDAFGAWNQRFILQFPQQRAVPEPQLYDRYLSPLYIHEGALEPFRYKWQISLPGPVNNNWADDWSADASDTTADGVGYYPVSPDWTDPTGVSVPVDYLHPNACTPSTYKVTRVLVEEWDGYTWRRVYGNGPVSGREMSNVSIVDTLPAGVTWGGWVGTPGTKTGNVLSWSLPLLRINESGQVKYWVTLNNAAYFGGCPVNTTVTNTAKISATNESPIFASVPVSVTCNVVPTPTPVFYKSGPAGPVASGANVAYVINYWAPDPLSSVYDDFSNGATAANWTTTVGAPGFAIGGGVMKPASWGGGVIVHSGTSAMNTTVTAHLQMEAYATSGIVFRASGNTYYYVEVKPTSNGQSQIRLMKSVAGTLSVVQATGANLTIPSATYYGLQVIAVGSSITVQYDTGSGWINPFGGPITDASIAGPGLAGLRTDNSPNGDWTDFSATVDRLSGVSIWDSTPANTAFVSGNPAPSLAPAVGGTGLVRWDLGTVVAGTYYSRTITVQVTGCPSQVVNQATLVGVGAVSNNVTTTVSCGTPTFTPAMTPTSTASATPTVTPSPSPTATRTPSPTLTASPSATPSPSLTASPSATGTRSATPTGSPSGTPSASPSVSPTASPSRTPTPTWTITFLDTYTVSPTITLSGTPSATRTASPSATPTGTPSPSPSASPTRTASPTGTPSVTATPTHTPVASATDSPTISPTASNTPVYSPTVTPTHSPTRTASPTATWTPTATSSATPTATRTASPTLTASATATPTATETLTRTPTRSFTFTATRTGTPTVTATYTDSPTLTCTPSISPTFTISPTREVQFYQQPELIRERGVYPNPFSDQVRLFFTLRVDASAKLVIYNVAGEPIYSMERILKAGPRELIWEGINELGGRCASGVYIVNLKAEGIDNSLGGYWTNVVIMR